MVIHANEKSRTRQTCLVIAASCHAEVPSSSIPDPLGIGSLYLLHNVHRQVPPFALKSIVSWLSAISSLVAARMISARLRVDSLILSVQLIICR